MSLKVFHFELLISIALLPALGCAANSSNGVQAAGSITTQSSAKATADLSFAFTEADVAAYEKGLGEEIALVRAARALAVQDEWEDHTIPGGAQAAGLSVDRYRKVRKAVNHVLETLDFQGKINGPLELDLEHAAPDMKQRLTSDPFAELAPASAAALRARMSSLVPVWVKYVELVAVNG
jgi:hypothetical protein